MFIVVDVLGATVASFPDSDAGSIEAAKFARLHIADGYAVDYRPRSLRQRLASLVNR